MELRSGIPTTVSRLLYLLQACVLNRDVEGCSETLADAYDMLQLTIRNIEDFLQRCPNSLQRDHDSAIGTPGNDIIITDNHALDTPPTKFPYDITTNNQELPSLAPNPVFDNLDATPCPNPVYFSPTARFFDFCKFYDNAAGQLDNPMHPVNQAQDADAYATPDPDQDGILDATASCAEDAHADESYEGPRDGTLSGAGRASYHMGTAANGTYITSSPHATGDIGIADVTSRREDHLGPPGESAAPGASHGDVGGEADAEVRQNQKPPPRLHRHQSSATSPRKRRRKQDSLEWPCLDRIVGKVARPDEIYQTLMEKASDHSSPARRAQYLTRLFFHFAGPHAFKQMRDTFSAIVYTPQIDLTTLGGRVRALSRLVEAGPIENRALLVSLCGERQRLQECAKNERESHPDRAALNEMVHSAYPHLKTSSKEYLSKKARLQKSLDEGAHWLAAHRRSPSALFSIPSLLSDNT